jgi:hypothetical protein
VLNGSGRFVSVCRGAGTPKRSAELLSIEWLQEVVRGSSFEGSQGIFIVGCDKNDCRHAVGAQGAKRLEAIQFRHFHIQENQVRRLLSDDIDGSLSISTFANDVHIRFRVQQLTQAFARGSLIIDDQHSKTHRC